MGRASRTCTLVAVLSVYGCAGGAPPVWRRVTTPHFVLETDLTEGAAFETAKELEVSRDALISAAWPKFDFPETVRAEVFALANESEFRRLFGPNVGGIFRQAGVHPSFCLSGAPGGWTRTWPGGSTSSILRHEMTHQLAAAVFPGSGPRWFEEGLATFLETVRVSPDGVAVLIGEPNYPRLTYVPTSERFSLKRTLGWSEGNNDLPELEVTGLYSKSWLFFFWLYHTQGEPFARYQDALAKGVDPGEAWASAFPRFDPDAVDGTLREFARGGQFLIHPVPFRKSRPTMRDEMMSSSDAHVARAKIAFTAARSDRELTEEAKREVATALELEPTHVQALRLDTWSPLAERLNRARRAVAAHPHDGWAYVLLSDTLNFTAPDSDEQEALRRRAVDLLPGEPEVLSLLGWTLLRRNKATEALPLTLRATKAAPLSAAIADICALALLGAGRCSSAIAHGRHAVALARDETPTVRERAVRDLAQIETSCRSKGAQAER